MTRPGAGSGGIRRQGGGGKRQRGNESGGGKTQVRYIFWERSGWAIGAPYLRKLGEHR